jgi:Asp-tRNA(Asn)/Glu-tRNA(Gln) amidotransferase A subunit family amidase
MQRAFALSCSNGLSGGCSCPEGYRSAFGALADFPLTLPPAAPVDTVDESTIPMSRYTNAGSCLDLRGIGLLNGVTSKGLPTGVQLMFWSGSDAALLDFAEQVSQAIGS